MWYFHFHRFATSDKEEFILYKYFKTRADFQRFFTKFQSNHNLNLSFSDLCPFLNFESTIRLEESQFYLLIAKDSNRHFEQLVKDAEEDV